MDLTVGAEDVDGLTLVTGAGRDHQRHDRQRHRRAVRFQPRSSCRSRRGPGSPDAPGGGQGPGGSRVGDDWSFSLRNITDAVLIRAQAPQGWAMKSVVINGQDITDTPTEFPAGQTVSGMQIVLTKKITVAVRAGHGLTRQSGARRDGGRVPERREAVDLPVAIHQGGAARSGRQVSRDRRFPARRVTWWLRCRASRTARPAIPSFSRRSRIWRQDSNSARANRRRLTSNCSAK